VFRGTCGDYRVLSTFAHGPRVPWAPGIPRALTLGSRGALLCFGRMFMNNSGASCRENVKSYRSSFRDAPLGAGPESITPVFMLITKHCHREYRFRAHAKMRVPE
jgi:hypothetical protein